MMHAAITPDPSRADARINSSIGEALARGYTREIINQAEARRLAVDRAFTIRNIHSFGNMKKQLMRDRFSKQFFSPLRPVILDRKSTPCRSLTRYTLFTDFRSDEVLDGLKAVSYSLLLQPPPRSRPDLSAIQMQCEGWTHIDFHAIQRIVMRRRITTYEALGEEVKDALAWSEMADQADLIGNFLVPTEHGIYAIERAEFLPDKVARERGTLADADQMPIQYVSRIKTFIDGRTMNSDNQTAHLAITDALKSLPKLMLSQIEKPHQGYLSVLDLMREFGAQWEARRAYARSLGKDRASGRQARTRGYYAD